VGLRKASLHASAAFLSSIHQTKHLVRRISGLSFPEEAIQPTLQSLASSADRPDWSLLDDIDVPISQKHLSHEIDQHVLTQLLSQSPDDRFKALALSSSIRHSGDWLHAMPSLALGLHFFDREFRLCLQYWLGVRLSNSSYTCPFCAKSSDPFGDHGVSCGGNGDRITRHNTLRDIIFSVASSASVSPRKEVPSLIPDSTSRPADLFLPSWSGGKPTAMDVTVINPLQQLTLSEASSVQGAALIVAANRKRSIHAAPCKREGIAFIPLAVESIGGWSKEATMNISRLAQLQGLRLGLNPNDTISHLFQRLSVGLWRCNATMWASRLPLPSPMEDGDL
jgi:hypothetical protein